MGIGRPFCIPPAASVPNGSSVLQWISVSGSRSLLSVPSILEDIVDLPGDFGIEALARLQFIAFGGGLLKQTVGKAITSAGGKLLNHYGATESGPLAPIFVPNSDYDWKYFRLRKDIKLKFEPVLGLAGDGVQRYKLITYPFGQPAPFEIQDQIIMNPCNPRDFNAIGRKDDLIVLIQEKKLSLGYWRTKYHAIAL